jgi:hypothetical protein
MKVSGSAVTETPFFRATRTRVSISSTGAFFGIRRDDRGLCLMPETCDLKPATDGSDECPTSR